MVNLEHLEARGLRAYEFGRMRMATKVAIVLAPLAAVCLLESRGREACACLSVVLLLAAVGLRWRDRDGVQSVDDGLVAGSIPLAFGLLLGRFAPECAAADLFSDCTAFSVLIGAVAGAVVAVREARHPSPSRGWVTAFAIAMLAASMGCIRLGVARVLGVAVGVAVGRALLRARRTPSRSG